jgi:hypothetical protein
MLLFLDWQSDGIAARLALVLYGVILVIALLPGLRRCGAVSRLVPAALAWHGVVWAFIAFWLLPYYAAVTGADCYGYHHNGMMVAQLIRAGNWGAITWQLGSDTMPIVTGLLYAPFGGDIYGMLFFSAALGFCAALYLCRAFALWATPAQLKLYALIILFLPSLGMWAGYYGKDSWVALGLGMAAYGYSSTLKPHGPVGVWHLLAGVAIVTVIRPHIALVLAASMGLAYVWGLTQSRRLSVLAKLGMIVMLIAMFGLLAAVARGFLGLSEISADSLQEYARAKSAGNALGGSAVEVQSSPGVVGALLNFPRGVVRVLFQPFPWEIHNFAAGMAALENLFILWFVLSRAGRMRKLFRGMVRRPYILFSSLLAGMLLLMFSFIPNLGLLSRQRVQLLPFLFVVLVGAEAVQKRGTRPLGITSHAWRPRGPGRTSPLPQPGPSLAPEGSMIPSAPRVHGAWS